MATLEEKVEEKKDIVNPSITIEMVDEHPVVTMIRWEYFNARVMNRVNRAISRQRLRLRRTTIKEAKHA